MAGWSLEPMDITRFWLLGLRCSKPCLFTSSFVFGDMFYCRGSAILQGNSDWFTLGPPKIHNYLFCLVHIQDEMIFPTPRRKAVHHFSVLSLLSIISISHTCRVIWVFLQMTGTGSLRCTERESSPLRCSSAADHKVRHTTIQSHKLWAVCQAASKNTIPIVLPSLSRWLWVR